MNPRFRRSLIALSACLFGVGSTNASTTPTTATPIKHLIVVVGENHTFDGLFGTYQPKPGQSVKNLLSEGIVNADGSPGANFSLAAQNQGSDSNGLYTLNGSRTGTYATLPQPEKSGKADTRFPSNLPNGPFQITKYAPYSGKGAQTGDPVHRFFQMWQQTGGTNQHHDLFVWVADTTGLGGNTFGTTAKNPKQGGELMGFLNMQTGDAPYFKSLADQYAISDNYHQAVIGGTGMNFFALSTAADLPVYNVNGALAAPPANQIENPNPTAGTTNFYQQDGYQGGSYVNCSDPSQPGVAAVTAVLSSYHRASNCVPGAYHLVNNYNPPYDVLGKAATLGSKSYIYPPQTVPTIAEALSAKSVSWKWYTGGRDQAKFWVSILGPEVGGLISQIDYNQLADPLMGEKNIVTGPLFSQLVDVNQFYSDLSGNTLPSVSFVAPPYNISGHPGNSDVADYETFVQGLIQKVQAQPAIWADTAIVITTDEGGGYFDSGEIQPLDFFGDGPRIPLIVVSPYARQGYVDHTYNDHASISKFIEYNWGLNPLSSRSRDNLPNPTPNQADPYMPANAPAIGNLTSLFAF